MAGTVLATDADAGDRLRRHRLRDHGRGGPGVLLDRGDIGGADLRRGAELRGRAGPGQQQHLRSRGRGDQRCCRDTGEDGDADDHSDGDGREHGGTGQAGRADGVVGVGIEPERELVGAVQRGSGDHGLRRAVPGGQQRGLDGRQLHRHRHHGDADGPVGEHLLPGAGAGDQRRGHGRVVGLEPERELVGAAAGVRTPTRRPRRRPRIPRTSPARSGPTGPIPTLEAQRIRALDHSAKGSNVQADCASTEPFRAFWNPPSGSFKIADEWEAEVDARERRQQRELHHTVTLAGIVRNPN